MATTLEPNTATAFECLDCDQTSALGHVPRHVDDFGDEPCLSCGGDSGSLVVAMAAPLTDLADVDHDDYEQDRRRFGGEQQWIYPVGQEL